MCPDPGNHVRFLPILDGAQLAELLEMRTIKAIQSAATSIVVAALVACTGGESVDAEGSAIGNETLVDAAPSLAFGASVKGTLAKGQMSVYRFTVAKGDTYKLIETISKGDLTPDFTVYSSSKISSTSHKAEARRLEKSYQATTKGVLGVAVKAFNGVGAGDYSLQLKCVSGPCAGAPGSVALDDQMLDGCLVAVRTCAVKQAEGSFGLTAASSLSAVQACAKASAIEGQSCKETCSTKGGDRACAALAEILPAIAKKKGACTKVFDTCMSTCSEFGEEEATQIPCLADGYNGTCVGYANDTVPCGGALKMDSHEECIERCKSTNGVWMDDLDTICSESCAN